MSQADFFIDPEDLEKVICYKWHVCLFKGRKYLARSRYANGKSIKVYLHREIMSAPIGKHVHHINGDTLDNRKENLLICTKAEHSQIESRKRGSTSKYLGVWREKGRWRAHIHRHGKTIHLGTFKTEIEAAHARRSADGAAHCTMFD